MPLILHPHHVQQMQDAARAAYPEECCGLLLGVWLRADDRRIVHQVQPLANAWEVEIEAALASSQAGSALPLNRRSRYWVDPKDLLEAQRTARDRGWVILGVYHSHPDHPAVPSECDRQLAWADYSYPILSVTADAIAEIQSWRLDDAQHFRPETIEIQAEIKPISS